ncbi:MAG: trehalose-6-phosphate synthase [Actinomycetota bacterium]|nr:trehalose-6-phosphate synthase [Actinomycetota bacterium]
MTSPTPTPPVIVLSHRGPVSFRPGRGGRVASRGAGGLVTALAGIAEHLEDLVWICAASTDEDRLVQKEAGTRPVRVSLTGQPRLLEHGDGPTGMNVRLIDVPEQAHDDFYTVIANPLLWFLQHSMYGLSKAPDITRRERDAFEQGYVVVNELFADAVVEQVRAQGGRALVMLQDYHFYLVAGTVRAACPEVQLLHFVHIPWPSPDMWRVLPSDMRERLLLGLLANDVVGFHTVHFARNFLLCAQELLGLSVDLEEMTVDVDGRTVRARHYPISIDVAQFEELAASDAVVSQARQLHDELLEPGECQLVLRVDRTDPSKNIVRGFRAFAAMLEQHPELVGKVTFLALLQPSRQDVLEYSDYLSAIGAEVARIGARYARSGYRPVELRLVEDLPLAVAAYTLCDVLMVNALADGMNLVAKEVTVVGKPDSVLALSENTGAYAELGSFAVTLEPFDIQQQADALYEALTMPAERRRSLHEAAAEVVRGNDVSRWLDEQLNDLAALDRRAD